MILIGRTSSLLVVSISENLHIAYSISTFYRIASILQLHTNSGARTAQVHFCAMRHDCHQTTFAVIQAQPPAVLLLFLLLLIETARELLG